MQNKSILSKPVSGGGSGDVTGPASSTDSDLVEFNGTTGKLIKDGALTHANVADAITKKHTQGTDQGLDTGGANAVVVADVKDAVTKRHTQNTDTDLDATFKATLAKAGINADITSMTNVSIDCGNF